MSGVYTLQIRVFVVTVTDLVAVSLAPKVTVVGDADSETFVTACLTSIRTGSAFAAETAMVADRSSTSLFRLLGVIESLFPSCSRESHESEGLAYHSPLVVTVAVLVEVSPAAN